jgi:hypothetical protein
MNLEQLILEDVSREMSAAVDYGIYEDLLFINRLDEGWHLVKISKDTDNNHAIDINRWLAENAKEDEYQRDRRDFIFKNGKDAMWFTLRWGS